MRKYEVNYTDHETGATSPIETVVRPSNYTAEQYIRECLDNADDDWNAMLARGTVTITESH